MHGQNFAANIASPIAMLHSGLGRRPHLDALRHLRDRLLSDDVIRKIWNDYEISNPLLPTSCTIESSIGTFRYETVNLRIADALYAIVVQVPDAESKVRLARACT
jgi:hypothetical protein